LRINYWLGHFIPASRISICSEVAANLSIRGGEARRAEDSTCSLKI
jgi:hypothetical protein